MRKHLNWASLSMLALTSLCWAAPSDGVRELQTQWAQAMYQDTGNTQEKHLGELADQSRNLVALTPKDADALVWEGIVLASYAGKVGGLGALSLVKEAKAALERAIEINPKAMDGSAYTSLGSLYYQVPGWPIGFGDDKKAEQYLKRGLEINPSGIDPNFFYGDYLYRQGRYDEAEKALQQALSAPPRPGRESADAGRRQEVMTILSKVRAKKG
ncbi:MAG TPA: tetratricopeptide repeat protein [Limnobacter sp.]|nr:tetratricopeptide repeat protein [Limnobacter sp.]